MIHRRVLELEVVFFDRQLFVEDFLGLYQQTPYQHQLGIALPTRFDTMLMCLP